MSKRQLTPFGAVVFSYGFAFYLTKRFFTKIARGIKLKMIRKQRKLQFDFKNEKAQY